MLSRRTAAIEYAAILALLLLLAAPALAGASPRPELDLPVVHLTATASDCSDIEPYRRDMARAVGPYLDDLALMDENLMTLTTRDMRRLSNALFDAADAAEDDVTPPPIMEDFHAAFIEAFSTLGALFREAATSGLFVAAILYEEPLAEVEDEMDRVNRDLSRQCPRVWDEDDDGAVF